MQSSEIEQARILVEASDDVVEHFHYRQMP